MQIQLSRTSLSKIVISSLREFKNVPLNKTSFFFKSIRPKLLPSQPDPKYCQINQTQHIAKSSRPKIFPNQPNPKYCRINQTQNIPKSTSLYFGVVSFKWAG